MQTIAGNSRFTIVFMAVVTTWHRMAGACPTHRVTLTPLQRSGEYCHHCNCPGSTAVVGCVLCEYSVCKWCYIGGHSLFQIVAEAEAALCKVRAEIAVVKARVDGDVFMWV